MVRHQLPQTLRQHVLQVWSLTSSVATWELRNSGNGSQRAVWQPVLQVTLSLTVSPRLECSGMIITYCSLKLLDSRDPPTSASPGSETTGMHCHAWIWSYYVTQASLELLVSSDPLALPFQRQALKAQLCVARAMLSSLLARVPAAASSLTTSLAAFWSPPFSGQPIASAMMSWLAHPQGLCRSRPQADSLRICVPGQALAILRLAWAALWKYCLRWFFPSSSWRVQQVVLEYQCQVLEFSDEENKVIY
ncbi:Protein PPP5D1 [Plecturocebus cupreus]